MDILYHNLDHLIHLYRYCSLAHIDRRESYDDPPVPGVHKSNYLEWHIMPVEEYDGVVSAEMIGDVEKWKYSISNIKNIRPGDFLFVKESPTVGHPQRVKVISVEVQSSEEAVRASIETTGTGVNTVYIQPSRKEWAIKVRCADDPGKLYVLEEFDLKKFKFVRPNEKDNE